MLANVQVLAICNSRTVDSKCSNFCISVPITSGRCCWVFGVMWLSNYFCTSFASHPTAFNGHSIGSIGHSLR